MAVLSAEHEIHLQRMFAERVTFDRVERKIYSHDIGDLPRLIKPLIGNTVPGAVVQPASEDELAGLVNWARENGVPLTPRGKATSGYGGVLPIRQGIVVDYYRMKKILKVDKEALTVTVEAGIVWEALDLQLKKQGLTLRLYPTSYMASTAGGWLAQGGAGIGSYEAGWFKENVISARVVLPSGGVREFRGKDLDLVSDAEGITGLIASLTLKVMPDAAMQTVSIAADTAEDLAALIADAAKENLPIWSMLFINPKMAEMKNQSPLREHLGHDAEERVELPVAYIATFTFREKDGDAVRQGLKGLTVKNNSRLLSSRISEHEWEKRFKVMLVKRLGPSLVPVEVVVPLSALPKVLAAIQDKIAQPIVKEGIIIKDGANGEPDVVILGFIPSDQRKFNYHFVFSLSLSIMKIAEKYGGRAYSTGLYFTKKAPVIFGKERLDALKKFKREVDPAGFMNPGKVFGKNPVSSLIGFAGRFEGMTRAFGNSARLDIGLEQKKPVRGIPADVVRHAYSCSQCGYCVDTCDQFYGRGWESQSPRGKWYWLREYMEGREEWNQKVVDTFLSCTTCELCSIRCSESLPIEPSWMKLRGQLITDKKQMTIPPLEMMAESLKVNGNIWAGYRKNRTDWFPEDMLAKHGPGVKSKNVYFAGCTASYVEHDIGIASVRILDAAGIEFTIIGNEENCCGTPMLVAGKWEIFAENLRRNIEYVKATGADTVISSCPACDMMWRHGYPNWAKKLGIKYGITAKHYSEVVSEKIKSGDFIFPANGQAKERVTWHDSCHMGRVSGLYDP
ncbi:MAG: FAD-binding oxidoreductase, partial [Spirochaetales bacterium]